MRCAAGFGSRPDAGVGRAVRLVGRAAFRPALLVFVLILASPAAVSACSCIGDIPLCQSFWRADAVFTGEIVSFESVKPQQPFSRRVARIRVQRAWRGKVEGVVHVTTGAGGGDCGYTFRPGTQYVVYAYRTTNGSWTTSICSPTKPLEKADADLEYFKKAEAPSTGGRVFGTVHYESKGGALTPAPRVAVILAGNSQSRSVVTADDGAFEFVDLPTGKYEVRVENSALPPWKAEIPDPHACAGVNMWIPRPVRTP
jgi:hypothetical protein